MTVDMMAATLLWPEGTLLPLQDPLRDDADGATPEAARSAAAVADDDASFWTMLLRHLGWPPAVKVVHPS